jgi:glycosyltransferase involved in cell wall biosynthesis
MLLENNPFPQDVRVRQEALTLLTAGHRVTVISPMAPGQTWRDEYQGVHTYRYPSPPPAGGLWSYLWEYGYSMVAIFVLSLLVLFRGGFDVIHAHNPPDTLALIPAFYRLLGVRFVYDHHDLAPEMYHARFGRQGKAAVHKALLWFEGLSCRRADHIITTNESHKALEMQRWRVPEEKITVVRNGPDLERMHVGTAAARLVREDSTILCYVGDMGFHDGLDYLMRSLHHLAYYLNRTDFHCVLVGGGDAWSQTRALSQQLDLEDLVQFTGRVSHHDVGRFISAADICLAPEPSNAYNDRCTVIKIMEYMALAKPTVAFDLPEHRVTAQDAALYAHPNDESDLARLVALLMDAPERRQRMGQAGRARIESQLSWSHQEGRLLQVYQALERDS